MSHIVTENPLDRDKDILGKTFVVKQCEAREHDDSNEGCVCYLIGREVTLTGREVTLTKRYKTPFVAQLPTTSKAQRRECV